MICLRYVCQNFNLTACPHRFRRATFHRVFRWRNNFVQWTICSFMFHHVPLMEPVWWLFSNNTSRTIARIFCSVTRTHDGTSGGTCVDKPLTTRLFKNYSCQWCSLCSLCCNRHSADCRLSWQWPKLCAQLLLCGPKTLFVDLQKKWEIPKQSAVRLSYLQRCSWSQWSSEKKSRHK